MAGFNFERDLPHQTAAVESVMRIFDSIATDTSKFHVVNPVMGLAVDNSQLKSNLLGLQKSNELKAPLHLEDTKNLIFDVAMETGTGKTYAYTKTIFELNKRYGLFKFIIAVPRVAIKAGTVSFLNSDAAREHFKLDYNDNQIKVYEVQSQKKTKGTKERMPQSILEFCRADSRTETKKIHVLVINAGMINSPTLAKAFDVALFDQFSVAFDAIAHTRPVLVIDEPHMFKTDNKTFANLQKLKPQFTLRYGATFDGDFQNLVHQLTAVEAFNQDLVKGIVAHVETFEEGGDVTLKLTDLDGEARFELLQNNVRKIFKLSKRESLSRVHSAMTDLEVIDFNRSKLVLSNGLELRKGDVINPYSYAETLQNKMIQQAIVRHFQIERELLAQTPRIKPLSLFFIDNIPSYRDKDGAMRTYFEQSVIVHLEGLIAHENDAYFKKHWMVALKDISATHGGYFSADNSDKDEAIERETLEILHDKESLLSLTNPRRFIFSKWTLREGWDNPNIFQICKLRSSGSETSKLQEVGRGLRLPVNEYMSRDKSRSHDLHYYVDFTEKDFIAKLTKEINDKSGVKFNASKLDDVLIQAILKAYPAFANDDEQLLEALGDAGIIKRNNDYKENGFDNLKAAYPKAFGAGLKDGKVKVAGKSKRTANIRLGKYDELKTLWEAINQKVVLEYKLKESEDFKSLFKSYLIEHSSQFVKTGVMSQQQRLKVENNKASYIDEHTLATEILPFRMMGYQAFLMALSKETALGIAMLHAVFGELLKSGVLDINPYMSLVTIREIKKGFNAYLMAHVFSKFEVGYRKTSKVVHPTKFTKPDGEPKPCIDSADVGVFSSDEKPAVNYLFDEIYYDSMLELKNINESVQEVIVYTKIPKNSIRIPLVGGYTYSPDFAYVVKGGEGRTTLNLVVEAKDRTELSLSDEEKQKIKHAETFFNQLGGSVSVSFRKQLQNKKMIDLIKEVMQ